MCLNGCPGVSLSVPYCIHSLPEARLSPGLGALGPDRRGEVRLGGIGPPIPDGWAGEGCWATGCSCPCWTAARLLTRPRSLGEDFYCEAIEHCRSYNARQR